MTSALLLNLSETQAPLQEAGTVDLPHQLEVRIFCGDRRFKVFLKYLLVHEGVQESLCVRMGKKVPFSVPCVDVKTLSQAQGSGSQHRVARTTLQTPVGSQVGRPGWKRERQGPKCPDLPTRPAQGCHS